MFIKFTKVGVSEGQKKNRFKSTMLTLWARFRKCIDRVQMPHRCESVSNLKIKLTESWHATKRNKVYH